MSTTIKTLDKLLAEGQKYATFFMSAHDNIPPGYFALGSDDGAVFLSEAFLDAPSKERFMKLARLMSIAYDATVAVFVTEVWLLEDHDPSTTYRPDVDSENQPEYVVLVGESREETKYIFLSVLREADGTFLKLVETPVMDCKKLSERFSQFLPKIPPKLESQSRAMELLKKNPCYGQILNLHEFAEFSRA